MDSVAYIVRNGNKKVEHFSAFEDSRAQGNEKLEAFGYIPLFLALAFLSLKGYGFYFRGNVLVLSQASGDMWPLN